MTQSHFDRLGCRLRSPGMSRVSCWLMTLMLFLTSAAVPAFAQVDAETKSRLSKDIKYLASDELEGRGIGTKGLGLAAEYLQKAFADAGLDVTRSGGDAYQQFAMVTGAELKSPNTLQLKGPEGQTIDLKLDADFRPCSFGGSGTFEAGVVFAGYGITAPDQKYDDLAGIDLKGKVVVMMRRAPRQDDAKGPFARGHGSTARHSDLRTKVSNAFRGGAVAVLLVNDPHSSRQVADRHQKQVDKASKDVVAAAVKFDAVAQEAESEWKTVRKALSEAVKKLGDLTKQSKTLNRDPLVKFGYGGHGTPGVVPVLHITQGVCTQLLKGAKKTSLETIETEIDKDLKPRSAVLTGWTAKGQTSIEQTRADVKNVIAVLEGEGPLSDETIVIGAHYDHIGFGGRGSKVPGSKEVHNGADDNASGTAGVLELARRLAARDKKLPRRIAFIAFTAEERGLIGSARYVKEPLFPLEKTVAMFNMDMIGRLSDEKLTIFGVGTAPRWKEALERLGKDSHLQLALKPQGFGPSDQASFYGKKIPVLHFFTGTHKDYHRPTDDWDKINIDGMTRIIELIEDVIVETAEKAERPKYVEVKGRANVRPSGKRPYFGSIPDFGSEQPGYSLSGTAPDSPAAKGGLKSGDRIVRFGKHKIAGLEDFDLVAIRDARFPILTRLPIPRQFGEG